MRRREFISLLGGAAAWPLVAREQQGERVRRIGVLMSTAADDPEGRARIAAFLDGLQQLGWTDGRNAQIDIRWPKGESEARKYAADLAALAPDVSWLLASMWGRCNRQPKPYRSYSCWSRTRSAAVSSRAYRGWAATPPGSCPTGAGAAGTSPPVGRRGNRGWVSP